MQLTERCIYFTWADSGRRLDIPLFGAVENVQELPRRPAFERWIERGTVSQNRCHEVLTLTLSFCAKAGLSSMPWAALTLLQYLSLRATQVRTTPVCASAFEVLHFPLPSWLGDLIELHARSSCEFVYKKYGRTGV
jgi:hypothetical protein